MRPGHPLGTARGIRSDHPVRRFKISSRSKTPGRRCKANVDGMVRAFYTWLRIDRRLSATDAMQALQTSLTSQSNRVDGGNGLTLADLTSIVQSTP